MQKILLLIFFSLAALAGNKSPAPSEGVNIHELDIRAFQKLAVGKKLDLETAGQVHYLAAAPINGGRPMFPRKLIHVLSAEQVAAETPVDEGFEYFFNPRDGVALYYFTDNRAMDRMGLPKTSRCLIAPITTRNRRFVGDAVLLITDKNVIEGHLDKDGNLFLMCEKCRTFHYELTRDANRCAYCMTGASGVEGGSDPRERHCTGRWGEDVSRANQTALQRIHERRVGDRD